MENRDFKVGLSVALCVAVFSQLLSVSAASEAIWGRIAYERDSLYNRIFVYQRGTVVTLRFGRQPAVQVQSQVDLSNLRQHMLEYTGMTFCGLLYQPEPKRVLVLGLGGGVIPREMHHYFPEAEIDVAEIDAEILPIAKDFFGFREDDKLKVHIDDGRMFIKKQLRREPAPKYDIVILDAFNGDYIPFHLMTKEFLEEVKGILAEDGVVVANVFQNNRLFDAELVTFLAVFGRCQVFVGGYSANAMLVSPGSKGLMFTVQEAISRANVLQKKHGFAFDLPAVAGQLRPDIHFDGRAKVLTDDRAPVNRLRRQERSIEN